MLRTFLHEWLRFYILSLIHLFVFRQEGGDTFYGFFQLFLGGKEDQAEMIRVGPVEAGPLDQKHPFFRRRSFMNCMSSFMLNRFTSTLGKT